MLGRALLQHVYCKVLTLFSDVIEVLVEVLQVVGILLGLKGVVEALLHGIVLLHVLGELKGHSAISWTRPGLKQFDLLEVILVQSSCGVG